MCQPKSEAHKAAIAEAMRDKKLTATHRENIRQGVTLYWAEKRKRELITRWAGSRNPSVEHYIAGAIFSKVSSWEWKSRHWAPWWTVPQGVELMTWEEWAALPARRRREVLSSYVRTIRRDPRYPIGLAPGDGVEIQFIDGSFWPPRPSDLGSLPHPE
jgi:hypothetical protein